MCYTHYIYIIHANAFRMCRHSLPFLLDQAGQESLCPFPRYEASSLVQDVVCLVLCRQWPCMRTPWCWFPLLIQDDEILLPFTRWLDLAQTECCVPSTHWSSSCQQRYVHARTHSVQFRQKKRRFLEGWRRISNSRWKLWAKKEIYLKMPASVLITQNLDGCLIQNKSETFKV